MRILYVSAEVEPFAKSGGLGDVLGAYQQLLQKKTTKCPSLCLTINA